MCESFYNQNSVLANGANHKDISVDIFQAVSEWYYDAILELTHIAEVKSCPKWIAKKLNLNINQVNMALDKLTMLSTK